MKMTVNNDFILICLVNPYTWQFYDIHNVSVNGVTEEPERTCLCILSRSGEEEYGTGILASQAWVLVAEAPLYIPSILDTNQHLPSQEGL